MKIDRREKELTQEVFQTTSVWNERILSEKVFETKTRTDLSNSLVPLNTKQILMTEDVLQLKALTNLVYDVLNVLLRASIIFRSDTNKRYF